MTLQEIKTAIENGAYWNGVVYGKNVGNRRNNQDLSIYLDGKYIAMGRVGYSESKAEKQKIIDFLTGAPEVKTETSNVYMGQLSENNSIEEAKEFAKTMAQEDLAFIY